MAREQDRGLNQHSFNYGILVCIIKQELCVLVKGVASNTEESPGTVLTQLEQDLGSGGPRQSCAL